MPLSEEQRISLWDDAGRPLDGLQRLSARPGTGKTTTVTRYCLDLAASWQERHEQWQGIAVLSYTNVAKDEVQTRIRKNGAAHVLLRSPHFLGTLDAFINQHLFLPHGGNAMGYNGGRPRLVGEPYQQWRASWSLHNSSPEGAFKPVYFDCYTMSKDARPVLIDKAPRIIQPGTTTVAKPVTDSNASKISLMKQYVWSTGVALQADANYLAYQTLKGSPAIAKALARRFPVLVIDEAQDMTEVQHAIVDALIRAGLQHVVLVGDENQAIYEWNTARPDLFTRRAMTNGWRVSRLKESYRCGPPICATLTTMAADGITLTPKAGGRNASYRTAVDVRLYDDSSELTALHEVIDTTAELLDNLAPHDGNSAGVKNLAVITRSTEDARRLHAQYTGTVGPGSHRTVWDSPLTRDFLKTVHHLSQSETEQAVRAYEQVLIRAGNHSTASDMRLATLRRTSHRAGNTLAYRVLLFTDLKLIASHVAGRLLRISDCATHSDLPLINLNHSQRAAIRRDCSSFTEPAKSSQDRLLPALFAARDERTWLVHPEYRRVRILFATTHAVKGETHDGVIFYTKHRVLACGCPQSAGTWKSVLQHSILECETKRIAYVACSRAAQALAVLAPAGSFGAWQAMTQLSA